jgi:hypothetical protein
MASKQITHKQHWIPRVYLKAFTTNKKLNAYEFDPKDKVDLPGVAKHTQPTPKGIAHAKDLYESPDLPVNTIEDVFGSIENEYGALITKIEARQSLDETERAKLAIFASALQNRTPRQKAHIESFLDRIDTISRQVALAHGHPEAAERFSAEIAETRKSTFADYIAIALDVDHWGALDLAFLVIESPFESHEFFTSDHPVSLTDFAADNTFYGIHPWGKTAESVVPLTPKIALFGNRAGITGYHSVDASFIREINLRTLIHSDNTLMSKSELSQKEFDQNHRHHRQSLLLKFVPIPDGRGEVLIKRGEEIQKKANAKRS